MTSTSTGVTTLVGHVTTATKAPSGNFQVTKSVQPHIEGIYLREQMLSLLAGTLPRKCICPASSYAGLREEAGHRAPHRNQARKSVISSELEVKPVLHLIEESWLVTWAGEDHYVVHEKKGRGFPSIFKLRDVQSTGDSRVLLECSKPPPRVFHCRTNSHWHLYYCGGEPEFYIEPALLPTPPQIGSSSLSSSSSLLKVQQEDLGLLEGHVISLVALSNREQNVALLVSRKLKPTISPTEHQIIFWNVKESTESRRFHEIERWLVTGIEALEGETILRVFVIRSGYYDDKLDDDAVVVALSSTGRVYVIKRKNPAAPHLVQSAGCEVRNLFAIGNGTKFCITYDGRYETRDVNTPEDVLMTVDITGFKSVEWETITGLMLAMSEKKVDNTESDNSNKKSTTIQYIDVRNVEDNRSLFRVPLRTHRGTVTSLVKSFSFSTHHHAP
ncbi:hypothetical protein Pelo_12064 [Pelomyxa schiedti]|nr:hypothetical protein Pelo_12064 [Pelomyxa schiedti]